jgi:hypothetical protein
MSLGLGIFASVVLILAVYNLWFRKVMKNVVLSTVLVTTLGSAAIVAYRNYAKQKEREAQTEAQVTARAQWDAKVESCRDRFRNAPPTPIGYWNNGYAFLDCTTNPDAMPKVWPAPAEDRACIKRFQKLLPAESGNPDLTAICGRISSGALSMPKTKATAREILWQVEQEDQRVGAN